MDDWQPKVSTSQDRNPADKQKRIVALLKEHPEGLSPKTIARTTGINVNTVKSTLKRLELKMVIIKKEGLRGYYILVDKTLHGSLFDWNFHNTIMTANVEDYTGENIKESLSCGVINFELSVCKQSKQATFRVNTNYPLNISSIFTCFLIFSFWLNKLINYNLASNETRVSCIEFNRDYLNLRLDGLNSLTITNLSNQFKIYQKGKNIREEYRITQSFNMDALFKLLDGQNSNLSISQELISIRMKTNYLQESLNNVQKMFARLLETLRPVEDK